MHIFNRVLVILALLAIMVVSAIAFIASGPFFQMLIALLQQLDASLAAVTGPNLILRWAGGFVFTVVVWAICVALLWLEVRRPRSTTIVVQQVSGGVAELTENSIISRLEYNLDSLPEIIRVKPRVSTGRKGVRVELAVETSPEVEVPSKSEQIQQVTRDIIENQMGLQLESMRVVMRHAPYPKSFVKARKLEAALQPPPAATTGRRDIAPRPEIAPRTVVASEPEPIPARLAVPPPRPSVPLEPAPQSEVVVEPETVASPVAEDRPEKTPRRPWSFLRPRAAKVPEAAAEPESAPEPETLEPPVAAADTEAVGLPAQEPVADFQVAADTPEVSLQDKEKSEDNLFS
jgi:uncharacterized alkaline shock family protein YloU